MIRINIKTGNLIKVKSFNTFDSLIDFTRLELSMLIGNDIPTFINEADALANKIWNTNVGQSFKTDLGEIISISGKSPYHNTEHGKQMYGS
jgi:hypothetical protein|tara:strand:+ start:60 stop:332 length:273 start_codon:yes stop_codon:yes gene_type:complete